MRRAGLLVLGPPRYFAAEMYSPPARLSADRMTVAETIERYGGIEGELWPRKEELPDLSVGLLPVARMEQAIDCYRGCRANGCRLIYIDTKAGDSSNAPAGFRFLGYDLGVFESEYNYFSVIFHDVLFGKHDPLRAFSAALNERLLIPSSFIAQRLAAIRRDLRRVAADLETLDEDGGPIPIAIFEHEDTDAR